MPSKVDDFWAQLKSNNAPKRAVHCTSANVNKLFDGLITQGNEAGGRRGAAGKTPQSKPPQPSAQQGPAKIQDPALSQQDQQGHACTRLNFDENHFRRRVQQLAEAFRSENNGARRQALSEAKVLVSGSPKSPAPLEDVLTDVAEQHLGKALLRRFDDLSEGCRELAASTFLNILQAAPQTVLALLPYAIPVLEERLCFQQNKVPKEPSEEVRLVLGRIVVLLIRLGSKAISAYAAEIVGFVVVMSEDPFHEVAMQACAAVVELNACLGMRLHSVSKQLVVQLLPLTTHARHTMRIAALQATKVIMHQNAHEMILEMIAWRDPNVIPIKAFYGDDLKVNYAGKLATDSHPMVRLEFLRTISDWMLNLRERVDHEPRLLPYALSSLNDSCPQVVEEALVLLDKLGEQYEREHANNLKDTVYYLPHEAHGLGWHSVLQEGAAAAKGTAGPTQGLQLTHSKGNDGGSGHQLASFAFASSQQEVTRTEGGTGVRQLFMMPGPFASRPRLGTRILVQGQMSRSLQPLLSEVGSWQQEPKLKASLLLRTLLVLGEDALHQYLQYLVPAFCKAIQDPEVSAIIQDCIGIVACYVPLTMILELLVPRISDGCEDLRSRAAAVEVLAHVVRGAGARGAVDSVLEELVVLIDSNDALLRSEDVAVQQAVTCLVYHMISTCGPACVREQERLLWLLLHLEAVRTSQTCTSTSTAPPASATSSTQAAVPHPIQLCGMLAQTTGHASVDHMVSHLRVGLLARCAPSECVSMALEARVLARLLLTFGDVSQEGSLLAAGKEGTRLPQLSSQATQHTEQNSAESMVGQQPVLWSDPPEAVPGTSYPVWGANGLDAALDRLLSQVPLLTHHAPSASTILPCLCSLLLHLPYVGMVGKAYVGVKGAQAGHAQYLVLEAGASGETCGGASSAAGSGQASAASSILQPGLAPLMSMEQGAKLMELLTALAEQVGDGVPRLWALRCLQQAWSTSSDLNATFASLTATSNLLTPNTPTSSNPHMPTSTLTIPSTTLLAAPLLWPLLPRLCHALCKEGLRSASPTVRVQACYAAAALMRALGAGTAQGGSDAPLYGALPSTQCTGATQNGSPDPLSGLATSLEQLAKGLLEAAQHDARPEVAHAAMGSLHVLLCYLRQLQQQQETLGLQHQQQPEEAGASSVLDMAADVLRQMMGLQQGGDALLVGLAQKVVVWGQEHWPQAHENAAGLC